MFTFINIVLEGWILSKVRILNTSQIMIIKNSVIIVYILFQERILKITVYFQ